MRLYVASCFFVSDEPPTIVDGSRHVLAVLGDTVELACRSRGAPKPWVTWFRNGSVGTVIVV